MPFQSCGSIRISHTSSTRIVNIHEMSKISEQLSVHLAYIKALHSTNGVVLLAVVVAREYTQDMLVVNRTVGVGFLGPLWICHPSWNAAVILSSGMLVVKKLLV